MNILGIMIPKIVALLIIIFSPTDVLNKLILIAIWFLKLIIDFDAYKPSHRGIVYRITNNMGIEQQDLIVSLIRFVPALAFFIFTIIVKKWLLIGLGIIVLAVGLIIVIQNIKDIVKTFLVRSKNATSNNS